MLCAGHKDEVLSLAVLASSASAGVLATGCEDGTVKAWGILKVVNSV
jgi:hypothetical protein